MNLDKVKQNTTWNDASGSINSNFEKIRQAILSILQGGGGSANMDVDTAMSDTSENAVQNKVIKKYVDEAYGQANKYTDEEIEHIEGVLNERIDGIVHVVYYYDGLSEEHKAENKKAYDAIMAGIDSCYVITDKTSSTKVIASAALKSSTIAGLMAYQMMPTSKDEITIGILSLSLYEDGSTKQTTTQSYVLNRDAVIALLSGKQDALVSGTTVKTINGQDILGEGDIVIEGSGSDIEVDSSLDMNSENPIQNQAVAKMFNSLSEYLQEQYASYSESFGIIHNQLPWISIVDFETAIEQEEPIGDDVRNALLEIGGYNPDRPYSTQGWVWSQGYLYTVKVIPTDAGVQIQLFSFKGWTEIAEDNTKVNHLPSQGGGSIEVDAELSETSDNAVSNKAVTMALAETEEVTAAALNELNERVNESATKKELEDALAEMDEEINHIEGVLEATSIEDEEVTAAALNDLDKRVTNLEQNGGGGGGGDIYNVSFTIDPSTMELVMAYDVQPTFDFTLDENGNLIAII